MTDIEYTDIEYIEAHIATSDTVIKEALLVLEGMKIDTVIQLGILCAQLAQAKVQLLSVQQAAEDRAMRMEQMKIGKSMMGMFGGIGGVTRGESKEGQREFRVHLTTGEDIVVTAASAEEAVSLAKDSLRQLGLDPSVVNSAKPVGEP